MKRLPVRTVIVVLAVGLLLAIIVFAVNAAHRLARSGPGHATIPPPPLHSAIGNTDTPALEAPPEEDAQPDLIGSADRPMPPRASAQDETESIRFVEGATPAE